MKSLLLACCLTLLSAFASAQALRGDYLETRSADIYTGQCFANGEVNLVGDKAIVAWHIRSGSWNGVDLSGMTVAAAVRAQGTLGDPYENPYPAEAVLFVDDQASAAQTSALTDFALRSGGELLRHVTKVVSAPMELTINDQHGVASLRVANSLTVQTRAINHTDHLCGNEVTFYPPLTKVAHAVPAVALTDRYQGRDLGAQWEAHGRRSAFVGSFDITR